MGITVLIIVGGITLAVAVAYSLKPIRVTDPFSI